MLDYLRFAAAMSVVAFHYFYDGIANARIAGVETGGAAPEGRWVRFFEATAGRVVGLVEAHTSRPRGQAVSQHAPGSAPPRVRWRMSRTLRRFGESRLADS